MKTQRLEQWDKKYVWHPFTQMKDWVRDPMVIIEKGKGSYLIDTQGRKYLDGVSSLWCNVHGHANPVLDAALKKQISKIAHSTFLGLSNVPAIELSKALVEIAPKGLHKVFYSDSGSEATEIALKIAFQYWQLKGQKKKQKFVRLENAYHGDTVGAVSVGGIQLFHDIFKPLLFDTINVKAPHRYRENFQGTEVQYAEFCAQRVEAALKRHRGQVAAMIMEPLVQGAAGMLMHPRGFLKKVRALTKKYDVLLIVDEVATGFGRTGKMFACEHEGVEPDILCVAKGLSGGYLPISATLTTDEVYNAFLGKFEEFKAFFHGHTYTANPLACAVSVANLRIFKEQRVVQKSQATIRILAKELDVIRQHAHVGEVRQCGLMVGIELVEDKKTKKPYAFERRMGAEVCKRSRQYGIITRPLGNVVVLMPSFSFTPAQIQTLCRATLRSINEITR